MLRHLLVGAFLLLHTGGAVGRAPTDNLRDALSRLPAPEAANSSTEYLASFIDIAALTAMASGDAARLSYHLQRIVRDDAAGVAGGVLSEAASAGRLAELAPLLSRARYVAERKESRGLYSVWRLGSPADAEALVSSLRRRHHRNLPVPNADLVTDPRLSEAIFGDSFELLLSPWYTLGGPHVLGTHGDALVQALSPGASGDVSADDLLALRDTPMPRAQVERSVALVAQLRTLTSGRSLAEWPPVEAILRALEGIEGRIVQAHLLSPAIGLQPPRVELIRPDGTPIFDLAELDRGLRAERAAGVPPYLLALMADLQDGDTPALLIALAFSDCGLASAAAERFPMLWRSTRMRDHGTYDEIAPAVVSTRIVAGPSALCTAVALVRSRVSGDRRSPNPAHGLAIAAGFLGGFSLLRIAIPTSQ